MARSIAVQVGDRSVVPYFLEQLTDRKQLAPQRIEALRALRAVGDDDLPDHLFPLLDDPDMAQHAATALGDYAHEKTPAQLIDRLSEFNEATRTAALNTLVARSSYATRMIEAMESKEIDPGSVPAFIVRQVMSFDQPKLVERLEAVWGRVRTTTAGKQAAVRRYREILRPRAVANANASNGRVIYEANCAKCHKLFGVGGDIGPDITGANRTDLNYWLENILDPNALIGRDYQMTTLLLNDGRVVNGIVTEENSDAVTIQTATEKIVIAAMEIDTRSKSDASLMPEGQLEPLNDAQVRELFKYLMSPGQSPLPADHSARDATATTLTATNAADALPGDGSNKQPNFIIVFCDDMGYADIGPFGAEGYETPHLDQMAKEGMRFTDFYVGRSFCSPSRAALMTGCIPTRVGVGGNFGPKSTNGLHPDEVTIADLLKGRGYATGCFGKWHLGHRPQFLPTSQGFDEFFGLPYSNDMWPFHPGVRHLPMEQRIKRWPHLPLYEGTKIINPQVMPKDQVDLTKRLTERAVDFIHEHKESPFFIYLPNPQPHVPLFASDAFQDKTQRGLYGDVISEIDWQMGELIKALKSAGIDDRTCVIFTSDNGPWLSYGDHAGSAKPLREGKGTNFEGGFRVSCLMRWPGRIPAGKECREVAGTIDLLPTIAKFTSAPLPGNAIDGKDISSLMTGQPGAKSPHEVFYHYDGQNRLVALRRGPWKLMFPQSYNSPIGGTGGIPGKNQRKELGLSLFNLRDDIGESTNVADQHPEIVQQMQRDAEAMRKLLGDGKEQVGTQRRPLGH